ncbi:putative lipid II flippase FtsW [Patescibacteria group bacterium]|nr:MAG: putative lipid II flippase FtsW [Patescibacteria group bacterium]
MNQVRGHRGDYVLAISALVLAAFGLILMYNINPALSQKLLGRVDSGYYFRNQLINIGVGLVALFVAMHFYYQRWRQVAIPLLIVAIIATLMLLIPSFNTAKNGATRWLDLGPFSFQPAELLKISMVIYLAAWFERRQEELKSFWDGVFPFMVMIGLASLAIMVLQRDMGTMMVLAFASLGMFYVAGITLRHLAFLLATGITIGWLAIVSFPHRMERFLTFLNPAKDADGAGYHISQALIAIGSGGIFGLGLGKSVQVYGYLPEASNDSIFAIIGEQFGLIGGLVIGAVFGLLIYRGLQIARYAPDTFSRLVATGITLLIFFQTLINIAAMLSLVPLTGIPLPFISYGGSSLVMMMVAVGILFNISKYTVYEGAANADRSSRRGDSRSYIAGLSGRRRPRPAR